jgi:hypothetical protein
VRRIGNQWITAMADYLDAEGCLVDVPDPAKKTWSIISARLSQP